MAASSTGVVAVENLANRSDFVERLERRLHRDVATGSSPILDAAVAELEEFLDGTRRTFDVPVDLHDRPAWDRTVFAAIQEIQWGRTTSYGMLARHIDRPGAARAVGGAVERCPVGLIVPCRPRDRRRRIARWLRRGLVRIEGAHLELKSALLAREGIDIPVPRT